MICHRKWKILSLIRGAKCENIHALTGRAFCLLCAGVPVSEDGNDVDVCVWSCHVRSDEHAEKKLSFRRQKAFVFPFQHEHFRHSHAGRTIMHFRERFPPEKKIPIFPILPLSFIFADRNLQLHREEFRTLATIIQLLRFPFGFDEKLCASSSSSLGSIGIWIAAVAVVVLSWLQATCTLSVWLWRDCCEMEKNEKRIIITTATTDVVHTSDNCKRIVCVSAERGRKRERERWETKAIRISLKSYEINFQSMRLYQRDD